MTDLEDQLPSSYRGRGWSPWNPAPSTSPAIKDTTLRDFRRIESQTYMTALSPPPTPRMHDWKPGALNQRLRSNSALKLHDSSLASRQYTEYASDGSPRSLASGNSTSISESPNVDAFSNKTRTDVGYDNSRTGAEDLPVASLFDKDFVAMVMRSSTAGPRLLEFARRTNSAASIEFLEKIEEYNKALDNLTRLVSQISKEYTSVTAISPLALPDEIFKTVNMHVKHFARNMLPLMERMYHDAKQAVEERISKHIYPDFIKYQVALCMSDALSASRTLSRSYRSNAYPGLGSAFCLTDPSKADNPITYVSDGLLDMSGYAREEILDKNCRILQGVQTDQDVIQRIRMAISLYREATELVLNYRKDGTPFWNLIFICPLEEQGKMQYWLGGQINVSESFGAKYHDLLSMLSFSPMVATGRNVPSDSVQSVHSLTSMASQRKAMEMPCAPQLPPMPSKPSCLPRDVPGSAGAQVTTRKGHRSRLLKPFRKSTSGPIPLMTPPQAEKGIFHRNSSEQQRRKSRPLTATPTENSTTNSTCTSTHSPDPFPVPGPVPVAVSVPDRKPTPYSRFLVLRYIRHICPKTQTSRPDAALMPVAFCSAAALEMLCLGPDEKHRLLNTDIFTALVDFASSPSVNKALRQVVREKIAAGETLNVDLLVGGDGRKSRLPGRTEKKAVSSIGRLPSEKGKTGDATEREAMAYAVGNVQYGSRMRKLISYWVPLKDAEGSVAWLVLTLTPAA